MYTFGQRSTELLAKADLNLQKVFNKAIQLSPIDFGISQTSRTIDEQRQFYREGKSKINPDAYDLLSLPHKAKHIVTSQFQRAGAIDIFAWIPGKTNLMYDVEHLCMIAGVIMSISQEMYQEGFISSRLRWGGNWDRDGQIIYDQTFQDLPHFELMIRRPSTL